MTENRGQRTAQRNSCSIESKAFSASREVTILEWSGPAKAICVWKCLKLISVPLPGINPNCSGCTNAMIAVFRQLARNSQKASHLHSAERWGSRMSTVLGLYPFRKHYDHCVTNGIGKWSRPPYTSKQLVKTREKLISIIVVKFYGKPIRARSLTRLKST